MGFKFNIYLLNHKEDCFQCVYVYPASLKTFDRCLQEEYSSSPMISPTLHKNNKAECMISRLVKDNKMVFPTNLIAEDFITCIKNMSVYPFSMI